VCIDKVLQITDSIVCGPYGGVGLAADRTVRVGSLTSGRAPRAAFSSTLGGKP
jgi:hypothetical protein